MYGIAKQDNRIATGSIADVAKNNHQTIAEAFMSAEAVIVVDTSASMSESDSRGGKSRYEVACKELAELQASIPGKVAIFSFSDDVMLCPGGYPTMQDGGTAMHRALSAVKPVDGLCRLILVSDGEPDSESETLRVARTFTSRIDTIYVGPEGGKGAAFLRELSRANGGQTITANQVANLSSNAKKLLASG